MKSLYYSLMLLVSLLTIGSCSESIADSEEEIMVASITMQRTHILFVNDTTTLATAINPSAAHDKTLLWTSSDTDVATVDANTGLITAMANGKAVIRAIAMDGSKAEASCSITVLEYKEGQIQLSQNTATLQKGQSVTLTYIVSTENASKSVTWTSSDTSVAIVDATGKVTAIATGKATIIAKINGESGALAKCEVTITASSSAGNHEYVDLGVIVNGKPVYWATTNIGAELPADYGLYFAWGETMGYTKDTNDGHKFDWASYSSKLCGGTSSTIKKYCTSSSYGIVDNKTILVPEDDAATENWGTSWRMPNKTELEALLTQCIWTWTSFTNSNGKSVNGYKVSNKKDSSKFIFLPAAGCRDAGDLNNAGSYGHYWFSSLDVNNCANACYLAFSSKGHVWDNCHRDHGHNVRPVYRNPSDVWSITLDCSEKTLTEGDQFSLHATTLPTTATNKNVIWTSSNTAVVTVSSNGVVTAVKAGTAIITATSKDGTNVTASCEVIVITSSSANNHEYVDLGVKVNGKPVFWATTNIGAKQPADYGLYFAWGETVGFTKDISDGHMFDEASYKKNSSYGTADKKTVLDPEDDAATVNWGNFWRMPTKAEIDALRTQCYWTWTTMKNSEGKSVAGYKVSNTNDSSKFIFLPSAGNRLRSTLDDEGSDGLYWSATLGTGSIGFAFCLSFSSSGQHSYVFNRICGLPVRAVLCR